MSRSGYRDDGEEWEINLWRGAVNRAITGKRGQAFLVAMAKALDAMPEKKLARSVLVQNGECCAMGVVCVARGLDTSKVDAGDSDEVGRLLDIAPALAAEIAHLNDDGRNWTAGEDETPEQRWRRMRRWVGDLIGRKAHRGS